MYLITNNLIKYSQDTGLNILLLLHWKCCNPGFKNSLFRIREDLVQWLFFYSSDIYR